MATGPDGRPRGDGSVKRPPLRAKQLPRMGSKPPAPDLAGTPENQKVVCVLVSVMRTSQPRTSETDHSSQAQIHT